MIDRIKTIFLLFNSSLTCFLIVINKSKLIFYSYLKGLELLNLYVRCFGNSITGVEVNVRNKRMSNYIFFKGTNRCRYYSTGLVNYNNKIIELINENDCFYILVFKSNKHKLFFHKKKEALSSIEAGLTLLGEGVSLNLVVNSPNEFLLNELSNVLDNCGNIVRRKSYYSFTVKNFKSITEKVIPFLEKCGLHESKQETFKYWKEVANLISRGAHTTLEGLNEIKKMKLLMNNFNVKEGLGIVPYGYNLSSTVGYLKFSHLERNLIQIPFQKISVFIGILLSDASLQRVNKEGDARLQFKQKYSQFEYLYSVFFLLCHYCSKGPVVNKVSLQKKTFYALSFTTRSLPCITELYILFYPRACFARGKKIVPLNIYDLLTWEALAHWIQGDGTYSSGITIQTQSFTIEEMVLLVNVLIIKFQLECTIHTQGKYNVIYIRSKSIKKSLHFLLPYIHPTMLYKFKGPQYKLEYKYSTIE